MKIFLCHSSRDKALVREIRSLLPPHVKAWLDESELLVGMELENSIRKAIQRDTDYVVVFLGRDSIKSEWVRKELAWALDREKKIGHTFVLPVLLDDVWDKVTPAEFKNRFYLKCFEQTQAGIRNFTHILSDQLFGWVCQRLEKYESGQTRILFDKLRAVYSSRRDMPAGKHYMTLLSYVKNSLSIAGVSLNFAVGQSLTPIFNLVQKKPTVKVRLLLFNPDSKFVGFVARFANKTATSLANEINANLTTLSNRMYIELNKNERARIQIRLYDAPPVCSLTIIDGELV